MERNFTPLEWNVSLPYVVYRLEETERTTSNKDGIYTEFEDISFEDLYAFLYHGIRFQKYLEKLESIFKERKLLAGKHLKNYYNYGDNCNKGEYVSLLNRFKTDRLSFETFIEGNVSLLITRFCNAIETKYVDFQTWVEIKDFNLKHIYSYMPGECMVKDFIPLEYVKAIGVPYKRLMRSKGIDYADQLIEDIILLMEKYNISLPIVDTSSFNKLLVPAAEKIDEKITQQQEPVLVRINPQSQKLDSK